MDKKKRVLVGMSGGIDSSAACLMLQEQGYDILYSWQKGLIENANKLIRQYIPKSTDFTTFPTLLYGESNGINSRPREKLTFLTPNYVFFAHPSSFCTCLFTLPKKSEL